MPDLDHYRCWQHEVKRPPPKPDLLMPAMPPLGLIGAAENWFRAWVRRRRFRQCFAYLLDYDDHILADMGHCRAEIEWASHLPLSVDAYQALQCRRARRRRLVDAI